MTKLQMSASAGILALAMALTACGNSTSDPEATTDTEVSTEATTSADERPTKEALLARFDDALAGAQATNGPGSPAMWTLADEDTTIHIFGTVHLLRPDLEWRSEAFDTAFANADTVVFEVDMKSEEAQRAIATDFLARGMYQDGRTLKGVLNDEDEAVISAAFDSLGVPIDAMNTFEPWMASVNLGVMQLVNDGYDPNSGVETVLESEAVAAGKSFGYLESISQQADAFDLLPEDEQISILYETALLLEESPRMLDLLVDEWADGDVNGIATLVANPDGYGFTDAAYQSLLVVRNEAWVPQIEAMLEEPGSVFIAVGAGHLAGPDSVITMLRDKGYTIEGP
ncbi:MAG: TraB/GumN family protein [Hyphomonadaceae bacterium]|nr:TraB/GumN family protein [Hyphomonadaceae bacterium]